MYLGKKLKPKLYSWWEGKNILRTYDIKVPRIFGSEKEEIAKDGENYIMGGLHNLNFSYIVCYTQFWLKTSREKTAVS
jgi:hypothetical protein